MKNEIRQNISKKISIFMRLYFLALKSFFVSLLNLFLGFILITFVTFVWMMLNPDDPFILASAVGAVVVRNGMHLFFRTYDMHKINFNYRIHNTPLNPIYQSASHLAANFSVNFLISLFLISLTFAIYPSQREAAINVNWFVFIIAAISLWILEACITLSLARFINNSIVGLIISIFIFIISWNFLGLAFPYHIVAQYDVLNMALYFFPPRYMLNTMQAAWVGQNNLVFIDYNYINGLSDVDFSVDFRLGGTLLIPFAVTYGIIILLLTILFISIIKKMRNNKKDVYGSHLIQKLSNQYIRDIKRCTNFNQLNDLRKIHFEEQGLRINKKKINKSSLKIKKVKTVINNENN